MYRLNFILIKIVLYEYFVFIILIKIEQVHYLNFINYASSFNYHLNEQNDRYILDKSN